MLQKMLNMISGEYTIMYICVVVIILIIVLMVSLTSKDTKHKKSYRNIIKPIDITLSDERSNIENVDKILHKSLDDTVRPVLDVMDMVYNTVFKNAVLNSNPDGVNKFEKITPPTMNDRLNFIEDVLNTTFTMLSPHVITSLLRYLIDFDAIKNYFKLILVVKYDTDLEILLIQRMEYFNKKAEAENILTQTFNNTPTSDEYNILLKTQTKLRNELKQYEDITKRKTLNSVEERIHDIENNTGGN